MSTEWAVILVIILSVIASATNIDLANNTSILLLLLLSLISFGNSNNNCNCNRCSGNTIFI